MFIETIKATGALTIVKNGEVVVDTHNLVVTTGKALMAGSLSGVSAPITKMNLGTGTVAAALANTALGNQLDSQSLAVSGGVHTADTVDYSATWLPGEGTGAITEAGLFSAADVMLARTVFSVVNKGDADTVTITWAIKFS